MAIDIIVKQVAADDVAGKELLGRTVPKTIRLILFGTANNANWAAERGLRRSGYPFIEGQIAMHHSAFKMKIGDLFKLTVPQYAIVDKVCRVMGVSFGDIKSEDITINFMEDLDYITNSYVLPEPVKYPPSVDWSVEAIDDFYIVDAPFNVVGDNVMLMPLVGRKKGTESGFQLFMSYDGGTSYNFLKTYTSFCIHGTLVEAITQHYPTVLDRWRPITIDLTVPDEADAIETIQRSSLFAGYNQAILFDGTNYGELFCFQTVTPDENIEGRVYLTGLVRGKNDTQMRNWEAGTDFFFIRPAAIEAVQNANFFVGSEKYFKIVPFNSKFSSTLEEATGYPYTITGRGKSPYPVSNLSANGIGLDDVGPGPSFKTFITLDWDPSYRGTGAGIGNPDVVTDAEATWEGYFEVEVYIDDILVRTEDGIASKVWTYTQGMHSADNLGVLADSVFFKVRNALDVGGETYRSEFASIRATRVSGATTTTTVSPPATTTTTV